VLSFYREMIRLRKLKSALIFGSYRELSGNYPRVYAYLRRHESERLLVILNFSNEPVDFAMTSGVVVTRRLISNVPGSPGNIGVVVPMQPWEAMIFEA
jgi:glycosidase